MTHVLFSCPQYFPDFLPLYLLDGEKVFYVRLPSPPNPELLLNVDGKSPYTVISPYYNSAVLMILFKIITCISLFSLILLFLIVLAP